MIAEADGGIADGKFFFSRRQWRRFVLSESARRRLRFASSWSTFDRPEFSRENSSTAGGPRENSGLSSVSEIYRRQGKRVDDVEKGDREERGRDGRVQFDTGEYIFEKADTRTFILVSARLQTLLFPSSVI